MEHELLTLTDHLCSPPFSIGCIGVFVLLIVSIYMLSRFEVHYNFYELNHVQLVFAPICFVGVHDLMLYVLLTFIGVQHEFHIKHLCCLMTGVTSHSGSSEFTPVLVRVCVALYLVVVFYRSFFVPLYILFWPL